MSKLYTAFLFLGHPDPKDYHVTHKYLGERDDREKIVRLLEAYLDIFPFKSFQAHFGYKAADIPRAFMASHPGLFLPDLRRVLDCVKLDDYPSYRPHVSVGPAVFGLPSLEFWVTCFVLVENGEVVWRAPSG